MRFCFMCLCFVRIWCGWDDDDVVASFYPYGFAQFTNKGRGIFFGTFIFVLFSVQFDVSFLNLIYYLYIYYIVPLHRVSSTNHY